MSAEDRQTRQLGTLVRLVTTRAGNEPFKVGLEHIEGWTGRLIESDAAFEGEGVAFQAGDVLFGKLRPYLAKVWVADRPGAAVGDFLVLRPQVDISPRFAAYLIRRPMFINLVSAAVYGSKMPRVSWEILKGIVVPTATPQEQVLIADHLDRETAEIDAFIADQEELIALLGERRRAVIDSAVLDGRTHLVEVRRLGAHMQSGTSVNGESSPAETGEVGVLRTGSASKGYLDLTENKRVVAEDLSRVSCHLRVGTVLVNRANTADLVASAVFVDRSEPGLYLSDKLWQIEFDDALSEFMALWAQTTDYRQQVQLRCVGSSSSMQNLAYENYLNLQVPFLPLDQQRTIVRKVGQDASRLDATIADAREAIALSKERRAALVSAVVTGQIDVMKKNRVLV